MFIVLISYNKNYLMIFCSGVVAAALEVPPVVLKREVFGAWLDVISSSQAIPCMLLTEHKLWWGT